MQKDPQHQPAIPIDLTKLPQFAPREPRWPVILAALGLLLLAVLVVVVAFEFLRSRTVSPPPFKAASEIVSRAEIPPLALPPVRQDAVAEPVSRQIRAPLRITDRNVAHLDLRSRVEAALADLDVAPATSAVLGPALVRSLAQGQSDAFVDAVLDGPYPAGGVPLPPGLLTPAGDVDTGRILAVLLAQKRG